MAEITITGDIPAQPRQRVRTLGALAEALSKSVGEDPSDAVFCLLVAAAHIALTNSTVPPKEAADRMAEVVAHAFTAAGEFFPPRSVQ